MRLLILLIFVSSASFVSADPSKAYQEMLSYPVAHAFPVRDLHVTRDAATFEFQTGEIQLIAPVSDRHHAALFTGKGIFRFKPPNAVERDQLYKFTGVRAMEEPFDSVLLRFSDSTAAEILKSKSGDHLQAIANVRCDRCSEVRKKTMKQYLRNFDSRILRDFYSGTSGYFMAYVFGKNRGEFLLEFDPEQTEQMSVVQRSRMNIVDVWSSFSTSQTPPSETITIPHFEVELDIEKDGKITAQATLNVRANVDSRAIALNFSRILDLQEIKDAAGSPCFFIFETAEDRIGEPPLKQDKLDVFLPAPLKAGAETVLSFTYRSDHLIKRQGNRNEYLIQDTVGWFPSSGYFRRSSSKATYCYPADLELFAVGKKVNEFTREKKMCSVWEQKTPVAMISFSLGNFKHKTLKIPGLPTADIFSGKHHSGLRFGGSALDNVAADVVNSLNFFQTMFGPYPFDTILATEIPADHGQGFPGFLHLRWETFEDASLKGIDEAFRAHEVSHQWWGHLVAWETYRDQWISEAFAEFSGALYADAAHPDNGLLLKMVESWKADILNRGTLRRQRYGAGKLPGQITMGTEAGPIWLGIRLSSSKSPADYRILVYEKGAYVLHMLRWMMKDFKTNSDKRFFAMMQDFVKTYSWKNATTEGFHAIAEKHYGSSLDWFFDQWVYGTYVPKYTFRWRLESSQTEGEVVLVMDVEQTNVPNGFRMPVPVYLDFGKDRFAVHRIFIDEQKKTIRIPLPEKPRDVRFNYQLAVLSRD